MLVYMTNFQFSYYDKLIGQCEVCYNSKACQQCIFQIENIDADKVICPAFMNKESFSRQKKLYLRFLEKYPSVYEKIMKEVVLQ